jgi:hypothetical protein
MRRPTVTVETVLSWKPCSRYNKAKLVKLLGKRKAFTLRAVLDAPISQDDVLWAVLREKAWLTDAELRLFACDCASRALKRTAKATGKPSDPRSLEAVKVARRFARGRATIQELNAARDAAWAARAAAWDEAWDAAWAAAGAAAWAARAAAWDAARAAAGDAARDAAWAARDAAWDAERKSQIRYLRRIA